MKNMNETIRIKAIGYARVSTDKQDNSADAQERRIRAQAAAKEIDLSEVIVDIDEFSGDLNRPGAIKLMDLVTRKQVQAVIITKLDRLTRDVRDALDLADLFRKSGVTFISIDENLDTSSPIGEFFYTVMAALGQLERKMIGSRTRTGLQNLKAQGFPAGRAPFGWANAGRTGITATRPKGEPMRLVPVPEEQRALARLMEMKDNRLRVIAETLNKEGFRTRAGNLWVFQDVDRILRSSKLPGWRGLAA